MEEQRSLVIRRGKKTDRQRSLHGAALHPEVGNAENMRHATKTPNARVVSPTAIVNSWPEATMRVSDKQLGNTFLHEITYKNSEEPSEGAGQERQRARLMVSVLNWRASREDSRISD